MTPESAAARFGFGPVGGRFHDPQGYRVAPGDAADPLGRYTTAAALAQVDALSEARRARNRGKAGAEAEFERIRAAIQRDFRDRAQVMIARAVDAGAAGPAADFRERLVWFWTDHFAVAARRPRDRMLPVAFADEAIRPHVAGPFARLLRAATLHPAMLTYLDQTVSIGPGSRLGQRREAGLNENLARELLELHTLGAGSGYTQDDVRQLAELLTGLTTDRERGTIFDPRRAEPGAETVLGRRYGGDPARIEDIEALLDDLAADPRTARHIAAKLARHFVADDPDPAIAARLAAVWADTRGDLAAVANALAADPAVAAAPPAKVRRPFELVVAALRALGLDGAAVMALPGAAVQRRLIRALAGMGQPFLAPPGPNGFPEAEAAWITPQRLAARIDWAMTEPAALVRDLPDPREFALAALGQGALGVVGAAAAGAETRAEGVGLVLASPAFNRR